MQFLFPVSVPPEVLTCFHLLDVVSPQESGLAERLLGLSAIAELYAQRRRSIEAITEERDHPLLRELAHVERERLADLEQEMLQQTEAIERELAEIETSVGGLEEPSTDAIAGARSFLYDIRALLTSAVVSGAPQVPNAEEVQRILEGFGAVL